MKAELGKQAAALLKDGDTVFMDATSTVRHIVDYIYPEQNLTIITNSMKVMEKLTEKHIRCYLTGGMLLENSFALIGRIAEMTLSDLPLTKKERKGTYKRVKPNDYYEDSNIVGIFTEEGKKKKIEEIKAEAFEFYQDLKDNL